MTCAITAACLLSAATILAFVSQASLASPFNSEMDRLNAPLRFGNDSPKKSPFASSSGRCPPWPPCTDSNCKLPKCFCAGSKIPGGLKAGQTPQMVVLTFQNALNSQNYGFYTELFDGRRNPNKCPASATFFVSHPYTDYYLVQSLYAARHEIGLNGATPHESADWWKTASVQQWYSEINAIATILNRLANIKLSDLSGWRTPYLQMGDDNQMAAIQKLRNVVYDSTRVSVAFSQPPNLTWPYTYDYANMQDCPNGPCPDRAFPGVWEVPILDFKNKAGQPCATVKSCDVKSGQEAFDLLLNKFQYHYTSNRAPMVVVLESAWVEDDVMRNSTWTFLDYIQTKKDVYIVSANRALAWVQSPTPVSALGGFKPWQCSDPAPPLCPEAQAIRCYYDAARKQVSASSRWTTQLRLCVQRGTGCPRCYPDETDPTGSTC